MPRPPSTTPAAAAAADAAVAMDTMSQAPPESPAAAGPRRVSFARGPLAATADGHPAADRPPLKPRCMTLASLWVRHPGGGGSHQPQEPLSAHNIRVLAAELPPECAPSLGRLRRRAGLEPPAPRPPPPGARGWATAGAES